MDHGRVRIPVGYFTAVQDFVTVTTVLLGRKWGKICKDINKYYGVEVIFCCIGPHIYITIEERFPPFQWDFKGSESKIYLKTVVLLKSYIQKSNKCIKKWFKIKKEGVRRYTITESHSVNICINMQRLHGFIRRVLESLGSFLRYTSADNVVI